jgi:hypothetical protein
MVDQVVSEPFSTAKSDTRARIRNKWTSEPAATQSAAGMTFRGSRRSVAHPYMSPILEFRPDCR